MLARSLCLGGVALLALFGTSVALGGCAQALNDDLGTGDDTSETDDAGPGEQDAAKKDSGHNYNGTDSAAPGDDDAGIGGGGDDATTGNQPDTSTGGGTDSSTGNQPDTSTGPTDSSTGNQPDTSTGGATCNPSPLGSFTTKWHAPPTGTSGACLASEVSSYYTACLDTSATNATCQAWSQNDIFGCGSCLQTDSSASAWGPLVVFGSIVELNVGGCYQKQYGNAASNCAKQTQYTTECEHASCDASCSSSVDDLGSCATAADGAACQTYKSAADSACTSYTTGNCALGSDFKSSFLKIAAVFCE